MRKLFEENSPVFIGVLAISTGLGGLTGIGGEGLAACCRLPVRNCGGYPVLVGRLVDVL